jgi:L-asparagine transporter-like permease
MNQFCKFTTFFASTGLAIAPFLPLLSGSYYIFQFIMLYCALLVLMMDILYLQTFIRFLWKRKKNAKKELVIIATYSAICTLFSLLSFVVLALFIYVQDTYGRIVELCGHFLFNCLVLTMFHMKSKLDANEEELKTVKRNTPDNDPRNAKLTLHGQVNAGKTFLSRFVV